MRVHVLMSAAPAARLVLFYFLVTRQQCMSPDSNIKNKYSTGEPAATAQNKTAERNRAERSVEG